MSTIDRNKHPLNLSYKDINNGHDLCTLGHCMFLSVPIDYTYFIMFQKQLIE